MSTDRKVLVVTGASQGLGEGFVKAYKERGWRIVGNSRSIKPSNDPDYITVSGDVGDPAIARKVVQTALDRFGRVDTLINNAGIWRPSGDVDGRTTASLHPRSRRPWMRKVAAPARRSLHSLWILMLVC